MKIKFCLIGRILMMSGLFLSCQNLIDSFNTVKHNNDKADTSITKKSSIKQSADTSITIHEAKIKRVYKYPVNNNDTINFGYLIDEEGFIKSANKVLIGDEFLYVLDLAKKNIKKIQFSSGILSIIRIDYLYTQKVYYDEPVEIAFFNGLLYILNLDKEVYIITQEGKFINKIKIPTTHATANKYIYKQTDSIISIYVEADEDQDKEDYSIILFIKNIDRKNKISLEEIRVKEFDFYSFFEVSTIRGKKYSIIKSNGNNILETEFGKFKIDEQIPKLPNAILNPWYISILDFTNDKIVFMDVHEKEITLYVYQY